MPKLSKSNGHGSTHLKSSLDLTEKKTLLFSIKAIKLVLAKILFHSYHCATTSFQDRVRRAPLVLRPADHATQNKRSRRRHLSFSSLELL